MRFPAILVVLGLCLPASAQAHPHHEEEEDDLKDHMARMLRETGNPCATVVQVEEIASTYFITCAVESDGVVKPVVYTIPKQA